MTRSETAHGDSNCPPAGVFTPLVHEGQQGLETVLLGVVAPRPRRVMVGVVLAAVVVVVVVVAVAMVVVGTLRKPLGFDANPGIGVKGECINSETNGWHTLILSVTSSNGLN